MKRFGFAVLAGLLAVAAPWSQAWAEDVCRKFVPSAGVTVEVPCKADGVEGAPAVPAAVVPGSPVKDSMERREGFELQGNAYQVIQLADTAACEQACLADAKCVAVEFYYKKSGCGLFDRAPPVKKAKFIDVAIRKRAPEAVAAKPVAAPVEVAAGVGADGRPKWCGEQQRFNEAERLVCADAELSALDVQLQRAFDAAVKAVAGVKAEFAKLQAAEDQWASMRDACRANRVCVKAAYELRIEQLKQQVAVSR